ncbi:hypothetical protein SSX86_005941 [Deinandra increscens subsp. villosa]|uniref:TIR domain-containing protein n=1 Tax=Deinandra increscens subsp. villosa TaxID=3103831 RepID=A0AAP0DUU3_9ASTR
MASASSVQKSFKYDVFLSFSGEDTRKNFVDHLYHALKQRGINTYKDDEEIKRGKRISDELIRSIEDSKILIIVFSKNYASSSWCLDELVKIMECQKTSEQTAYPVFYDVEPTEVRNQIGAVGEAFMKHVNEDVAKRWRDALKEAAGLAGRELKNTFGGHEAKFIQKIVEEISLELRFINPNVDGNLVGMETRVKDVVSSLETDVDDVRLIGIKGMGGAGKTTLARAVFDRISFQFEGSSFVENVREFSKGSLCGLRTLQKRILSDVLRTQDITINGVYEGIKMMKQRLYGRKVLVVLDDVDHIQQLEALAGELNWFKPGSRVIITTREEQVLIAHGVPKKLILNANMLSHEEAICLFSRHAFGTQIPAQGYEDLSEQVVSYAAGLPLTIRVLGCDLCGKGELEWVDALERLKTIPLKDTLEKLELSYNSLEEDHKKIFLDVACLLKGWKKEEAIEALESCGFHAISGLKVLELKSLITVSESGHLSMHDHIEEMGQNIVRRLHPNEPYKHSRLWNEEETKDILVEDKGTEATRCIQVRNVDPVIVMKGLRKMKELRFLDVISEMSLIIKLYHIHNNDDDLDYKDIGEDSLYLPNGLQYLRWSGYPFTRLPKTFHGNNLVGLKMLYTNIDQLWEVGEGKVLKKLRFIDLSFCNLRSLDIGLVPNLVRLSLVKCTKLVEFHMPVKNSILKYLNLSKSQLRTLNLEWAQNLDTLKVEDCALTELHMPIESLKLKHLTLHCSMLTTFNIARYENLETLDLECNNLVKLHFPFKKLKHLSVLHHKMKTLDLMLPPILEAFRLECESLLELQIPIDNPKLKTIYIYCPKLRTLNLTRTWNLERLDLERCEDLVELHMPVESPELKIFYIRCFKYLRTLNLTATRNLEMLHLLECENLVELHMPIESPKLKTIKISCSKLRTLDLTRARNLDWLHLEQCEDLVELKMPIESPKLKTINIHCSKLRTLYLGLSPYLECLDLHDCFTLVELNASVGYLSGRVRFKPLVVNHDFQMVGSLAKLHLIARCLDICQLHPDNNGPKFHFDCIYKDLLPSSTQNLKKLITSLGICACTNLVSLSGSISGLQHLRKLTLEGHIPEVPKEIEKLECLEELTLLSTDIERLPDSICMLKHLKVLRLKSCWFLKQLPEDLGRLECLEELRITDFTSLREIPDSICDMKRLKCFHLINCILVEKLPKEMGRLKCLKELNIQGTHIEDFPPSIFQLEDLLFLL